MKTANGVLEQYIEKLQHIVDIKIVTEPVFRYEHKIFNMANRRFNDFQEVIDFIQSNEIKILAIYHHQFNNFFRYQVLKSNT